MPSRRPELPGMLPGPLLVMACPHCRAGFLLRTLRSGNTFGAVLYSDGLMVAPMLPRPPAFQVCHGCGEPFWLQDAERRGELEPFSPAPDHPIAEQPSAEDHRLALARGLARTPEEERILRVGWWWASNETERAGPEDAPPPDRPEEWEANLGRLAGLLDEEDPEDRLFLAEIARLRGRFDEARALLADLLPEALQGPARAMEALVAKRSMRVQRLRVEQ